MLARFSIVMGASPSQISSRWVEYPLDEWVDMKGSKIKGKYYIKGALSLASSFFIYVFLLARSMKNISLI